MASQANRWGRRLLGEDLAQRGESGAEGGRGDGSGALDQAGLVDGANLVEQDQPHLAAMPDRDAKGGGATAGGHGRDYGGAQMVMHLRRGDHQTGACLLNLAADGGIKVHQPDLATPYHFSPLSASLAKPGRTRASSPAAARAFDSSAQPARG